MENVGPVIFGTLAAKTQKSHRKDGSYKICSSPSVITFAKTHGKGQRREAVRDKEPGTARLCRAGRQLRETALAADYGKVERVQFIGDGAPWIENIARDGFKAAIFTLDCSHAFGYVNKVCEFLAQDAKEAKKVFRKVKEHLYEHDFDKAEKYLRNKYKAHFTEDGLKCWSEEASKAWKYLDDRRKYMNYGWLRRHGYLIGSGHIESACKV